MTGRIAEIRARLNATKRVWPYGDPDRHTKKQAAWSMFYQYAPSDIEWLLGQLEKEEKK